MWKRHPFRWKEIQEQLVVQKFHTELYHETHLLYFCPNAHVRLSVYTSEPLQTSFRFSYNFTLLKHSSSCLQSTCLSISFCINYHFHLFEYEVLWPPMMLLFLSSADLNHIYIYEFLRRCFFKHPLFTWKNIIIIINKVPRCSLICSACNTFTSWNCWSDTFGWNQKRQCAIIFRIWIEKTEKLYVYFNVCLFMIVVNRPSVITKRG